MLVYQVLDFLEVTCIVPTRWEGRRGWIRRLYGLQYEREYGGVSHFLDQATSDLPLTFADGTEIVVPIYGLRNSKATLIAHARERKVHDARCKKDGLPTMQEARAAKLAKKVRKKRDDESGRWDEAAVPPTGVEMCKRKGPQLTEYSRLING